MELSKSDKKAAREIIDKGLQKEFAKMLEGARLILNDQLINGYGNMETYHLLFNHVQTADKHLANTYDAMRPSWYVGILALQLHSGLISEQDLEPLTQDVKAAIKSLLVE